MKVRVTKSNLYRHGRRCSIGETFEIKGDTIPKVYLGKVEPIPEDVLTVATPDSTSSNVDDPRKAHLLDEIEKLTGNRPGANSKVETLEKRLAELQEPKE